MLPIILAILQPLAIVTIAMGIAIVLMLSMAVTNPSVPQVQDGSLSIALALPAAASTTVTSATGIDTGVTTADANQPGDVDFLLTAPALNATQLPNTYTVTYAVICSASSNMGTPTTIFPACLVQTGAGGVGAAAATFRFRLPSQLPGGTGMRYVGYTATTSASTGNCSAASATMQVLV